MPLLRVTHRLLPEGPSVLVARPRVFPKSSARSSPCTPAVCSPDPARPPSVANARRPLHHRNHLRRHCHPVHPPRPSPPHPGASTKSTTGQHRHHDESSPPPPPPGRPEDTAKSAATPACKPQAAPPAPAPPPPPSPPPYCPNTPTPVRPLLPAPPLSKSFPAGDPPFRWSLWPLLNSTPNAHPRRDSPSPGQVVSVSGAVAFPALARSPPLLSPYSLASPPRSAAQHSQSRPPASSPTAGASVFLAPEPTAPACHPPLLTASRHPRPTIRQQPRGPYGPLSHDPPRGLASPGPLPPPPPRLRPLVPTPTLDLTRRHPCRPRGLAARSPCLSGPFPQAPHLLRARGAPLAHPGLLLTPPTARLTAVPSSWGHLALCPDPRGGPPTGTDASIPHRLPPPHAHAQHPGRARGGTSRAHGAHPYAHGGALAQGRTAPSKSSVGPAAASCRSSARPSPLPRPEPVPGQILSSAG